MGMQNKIKTMSSISLVHPSPKGFALIVLVLDMLGSRYILYNVPVSWKTQIRDLCAHIINIPIVQLVNFS